MKLVLGGGSGNGPAGMKLVLGGGSGNGPAGMKLVLGGGNGIGPAGIAFAVQAVTTSNARMTTLRIFNVPGRMENSPGGGNPPYNFAREGYPNRVMESTTKVLFKIILHLSNRLNPTIVIKMAVTWPTFAPHSPDKMSLRGRFGPIFRNEGG
ncbi:MAG: hypothetical protein ABR860_17770 [Terracidiphilus sp.]|jgi:hypothetical protein